MRTAEDISYIKAAPVILIVNLALFVRVVGFEFINFDDDTYLNYLNSIDALSFIDAAGHIIRDRVNANWHPVTVLSLYLDWKIAGLNPGYFHFVNIVIHSISALILYLILSKLRFGFSSLVIALLFSVHPVQIETVAWIAERKGLLSVFFALISIYFYICSGSKSSKLYLFLSWFSFVLGMLAKASIVVLPFVLILIDYYELGWESFRSKSLDLIKQKWHYFLSAIVLTVITIFVHQQSGVLSGVSAFPVDERIVNAFLSFKEYILKLFYPINLSVFYPYSRNPDHFGLLLSLIILSLAFLVSFKSRKAHRYILFGWAWFFISLLPVIGLIKTGAHAYADRYLYFPSIGFFVLSVITVNQVSRIPRTWIFGLWMLAIAALASLSSHQMQYWQNSFVLFERALEVTSDNYIAHRNLSSAHLSINDYEKGMWHYQRSREIRQDNKALYEVVTHHLLSAGRIDLAENVVSDMLNSGFNDYSAFRTLGQIRINLKKYNEAIMPLIKANSIEPNNFSILYAIGVAYYNTGNYAAAIEYLEKAHTIDDKKTYVTDLLSSSRNKLNHSDSAI